MQQYIDNQKAAYTDNGYKKVTSTTVAKRIIEDGRFNHLLKTIIPNQKNKDRSVFVFRATPELERFINAYKS